MKRLISYIAVSLDGKIAKEDGDVSWLNELPNPDKLDYGYMDFYNSIDTVIMGNDTYKVSLQLSETFSTADKKNYVITRNKTLTRDENVTFISSDIESFVSSLKRENGKDIWLMGGAMVNSLMLNANLLDELRIYVIPIILGPGIPLFSDTARTNELRLSSSHQFSSGVVELIYQLNQET